MSFSSWWVVFHVSAQLCDVHPLMLQDVFRYTDAIPTLVTHFCPFVIVLAVAFCVHLRVDETAASTPFPWAKSSDHLSNQHQICHSFLVWKVTRWTWVQWEGYQWWCILRSQLQGEVLFQLNTSDNWDTNKHLTVLSPTMMKLYLSCTYVTCYVSARITHSATSACIFLHYNPAIFFCVWCMMDWELSLHKSVQISVVDILKNG